MAATPPAAHEAMMMLAAPTDRRSGTANAAGLLNIGSLPALAMSTVARDQSEIGTAACYRITDSATKGRFRDVIVDDPGLRRGGCKSPNSHHCFQVKWRQFKWRKL